MLRHVTSLVVIVAGLVGSALAQTDSTDAQRSGGRLALLPIVFSSPDTKLALGVLPQYIFYTASGTRPSTLRAG